MSKLFFRPALQAAHIISYSGKNSNHCQNGILLRADLHNLFDLNLLMIEPETLRISLVPRLSNSDYAPLDGTLLKLPESLAERPSYEALKKKFEQAKTSVEETDTTTP